MGVKVIVMGAPGAGKGTQAARLAHDRGIPRISTGDILRDAVREGNPTALAARARMDRGELVDDATMIAIVRERLQREDARPGFVLDGFPRTVEQARALDRIVEERGNGSVVVVDIAVPEAELVRRLAIRRICSGCGATADPGAAGSACGQCGGAMVQRADDNEGVVAERLRVYLHATRPVLEYYRQRPTFRVVDGAQEPARVADEIRRMIDDAAVVAGGRRYQEQRS